MSNWNPKSLIDQKKMYYKPIIQELNGKVFAKIIFKSQTQNTSCLTVKLIIKRLFINI